MRCNQPFNSFEDDSERCEEEAVRRVRIRGGAREIILEECEKHSKQTERSARSNHPRAEIIIEAMQPHSSSGDQKP
jgi:hypothetical protein